MEAPARSTSSPRSTLSAAATVASKEIREAVRDRQTILYTVVVPLAMYPVLIWIAIQVFLIVQAQDARTSVTLAIGGTPPAEVQLERVEAALGGVQEAEAPSGAETPSDAETPSGAEAADAAATPSLAVERLDPALTREDLPALLIDADSGRAPPEAVDAIVWLGGTEGVELLHVATRSDARLAVDRASTALGALGREVRDERLRASGHDPERMAPFAVREINLAEEKDLGGMLLSFVLPMMFIVMTVLGAFFPSVDLTAGEKERKTAETTLLAPIPRSATQLGKVLAVTAAAGVATTVNLVGMSLAAEHLLASFGDKAPQIEVPWLALLKAIPLGLVFLLATSAIMTALASFADTFKQGQALMNSVMMLFIFPAFFAMMPGVDLSPELALVPVIQTVLGFKALLAPGGLEGQLFAFALVVVSQLVYAGLALWVSLRLTTRESLALGAAKASQLTSLLRSRGAPR